MKSSLSLLTALLLTPPAALHAADKPAQPVRPDIVIADFEQGYGRWVIKGEAFNHATTPVSGAKGFVGKGLADSWDADRRVLEGSLTSPEFTLERNFIRFLVGGRGFNAATSLQLQIDGKLEFFACGIGDQELRSGAFDVSSFQGRKARFIIRDEGMWNFILVDQLVASDSPGEGARMLQPRSQCVPLDKQMDLAGMRYLVVPINNQAPMIQCLLEVDGQPKQDIAVHLAIDFPVDFWPTSPKARMWNCASLSTNTSSKCSPMAGKPWSHPTLIMAASPT